MNAYATASLYVGDLHPEVTEALLFELFNAVGPVASIRVCRDSVTRRSLGYAYVNFHSVVDAERALETMNYTSIKAKPCRIMWCHRDPSLRKSGSGNVFIKNLDKSIDNKALYDTFSAFGNILSCKVAMDDNGNPKGYGFVHYETQEAANLAVNKVNGMLLNGKKVFVGFFVPQKERGPSEGSDEHFTNVYVKNLDTGVSDEQLTEMFAEHGTVKSCTVMRDADGGSRGFGFVSFEDHEAAKAACDALNGKEINGKALYAGRAMKKKERERELRERFEQLKVDRIQKVRAPRCVPAPRAAHLGGRARRASRALPPRSRASEPLGARRHPPPRLPCAPRRASTCTSRTSTTRSTTRSCARSLPRLAT